MQGKGSFYRNLRFLFEFWILRLENLIQPFWLGTGRVGPASRDLQIQRIPLRPKVDKR
jgi:hypothetical protein